MTYLKPSRALPTDQLASEFVLRTMQAQDLKAVLEIERAAQLMPWGLLSFEEALSRDDSGNYHCRVVENENKVVAFHILSAIEDEVHILNIVVSPQWQGQGLGHFLLNDIVDFTTGKQANKIFLEVRASNEVAQSLYLKWQFKQIAIRKNYYRVPNSNQQSAKEDALVFMRLSEK